MNRRFVLAGIAAAVGVGASLWAVMSQRASPRVASVTVLPGVSPPASPVDPSTLLSDTAARVHGLASNQPFMAAVGDDRRAIVAAFEESFGLLIQANAAETLRAAARNHWHVGPELQAEETLQKKLDASNLLRGAELRPGEVAWRWRYRGGKEISVGMPGGSQDCIAQTLKREVLKKLAAELDVIEIVVPMKLQTLQGKWFDGWLGLWIAKDPSGGDWFAYRCCAYGNNTNDFVVFPPLF